MIQSSFTRPTLALSLLCATGVLAACGSGGEGERVPPVPADRPAQEAAPASPSPTTPDDAAPPAAEPAPSQSAPADSLPLTPGVYVMGGSSCANPANAAFRIFDGSGISGSATRACRLTVRSSDDDVYRVDQSCEDTYSGQRTMAAQTIRVPNARSFTLTEPGEAAMSFRLCPASEAPSYLQDMVSPG